MKRKHKTHNNIFYFYYLLFIFNYFIHHPFITCDFYKYVQSAIYEKDLRIGFQCDQIVAWITKQNAMKNEMRYHIMDVSALLPMTVGDLEFLPQTEIL